MDWKSKDGCWRCDASLVSFWLTTMWYERFQQDAKRQRFAVLYFLRGWYKQEVECHRHWPLGKKKFKDCCHHCPFAVSGQGRWWQWHKPGNSRTSIAVQRKLQKAGGLVGKKQWEFVGEACCHLARGCKRLRLEHLTRAARPHLTWAI